MLYICIHIYIFHLGMGNCIPLIPEEAESSRGLGKESGTRITRNRSCLVGFFVKESPHTVFFFCL